ncbi:uncharacterized protein LOC133876828 [Alnus glutinosa]|uniref:uncharacterized protein LOC133876828 n=1 Tax=Alnus glutinosa TaxID=3517 RepID=UPI002D7875C0|nr:uncharacterized protein LOC133876828 [Alnus glutinosa]
MRKLGFAESQIVMIMKCVSTVSYSVIVNSSPYGKVTPSRGLRQRDPLSPYLFLLYAEGLSSLLQSAKNEVRITGVPVSAGGFHLSHLFFANASLLFCRANFVEWGNVLSVLHTYELALRQKLNNEKTSIFFSKNTRREFRDHICSFVGISDSSSFEKCLGLPAMVGRSKTQTFAGIKSRVQRKLDG